MRLYLLLIISMFSIFLGSNERGFCMTDAYKIVNCDEVNMFVLLETSI